MTSNQLVVIKNAYLKRHSTHAVRGRFHGLNVCLVSP